MPRSAQYALTTSGLKVSATALNKSGALAAGAGGTVQLPCGSRLGFKSNAHAITFSYRHQDADVMRRIVFYRRSRPFGGEQVLFMCPHCHSRVLHLYIRQQTACRHCHRMHYPSQRENQFDRARRRAQKARAKLGWNTHLMESGSKPKGMHWITYHRLVALNDQNINQTLGSSIAFISKMQARLSKYN